ncbi:MAG: SLBB domain-containing protein [Candidatus Aegiribacteria sp.]
MVKGKQIIRLLVLVLGLAPLSGAQDFEVPRSRPLMQEVDENRYIVGPGDVFWFSVQGGIPGDSAGGSGPQLIEVTPDGYAVLPRIGAWKVSGLSLGEATSIIQRGFSSRYPGMSGMAGLARMREFQVPVTGHVNTPGIVEVTGADGLVQVLDNAGGIAPSGSMTRIMIIDSSSDTTTVSITDFLREGTMASNPYLSLGDRVHVPEAEDFVWIEGAVQFSRSVAAGFAETAESTVWNRSARGMTEFIPGETVSGLISRTGGTASWATRDSCYILRRGDGGAQVRIPAPLDEPGIDPVLLPGDLVVCPGIPPVVTVSGEVHAPGIYPHTAGMNSHFYITQAGGFLRASRRSGTRVVLPDGEEVKADEISSVPAGSAITVPRKMLVGWEDPLLVLTSLASIIIAWKSIF